MKAHIILVLLLSVVLAAPPLRLKPSEIKPYMFTQEISGAFDVLTPTRTVFSQSGKMVSESYTIFMEKIKTQMLPKNFPQTTIFAYGGKCANDTMVTSYPGPAIIAKTNVPVRVTWTNNIFGEHLFPVDLSHPFNSSNVFKYEVPLIPHVHGLASALHSDGQPSAYWTALGSKGGKYSSLQPAAKNQAVFSYSNQQTPGLFWYHDHTMGLTRLNVYAGLAGFYQIIDPQGNKQEKILRQHYGDLQRRALVIADKIFQKNGQLFYHFESPNKDFTSWIPQFFGDVMVVNGKVWPKMTLKPMKYRLILLNGCQSRFLNVFFLNNNKKIPFDLIRTQGDYYKNPVKVTQFFLELSARLQIVIDFTNITGDVMIKNNAQAPHPDGDPANLVDEFTGTIMKLVIAKNQTEQNPNIVIETNQHLTRNNIQKKSLNQIEIVEEPKSKEQIIQEVKSEIVLQNSTYPAFPQGQKVFSVLIQMQSQQQQVAAMFIDGISYSNSMKCTGRKFKVGSTYDFYIVNLTPDSHPIHMHLIEFQKVMQIPFDVQKYKQDWFQLNGGSPGKDGYQKQPKQLDPSTYYIGQKEFPKQSEKTFRDVINMAPDYVTVIRVKFAHNDGGSFTFDVKANAYVWHCHMLQHEDNDMMKFFCFE